MVAFLLDSEVDFLYQWHMAQHSDILLDRIQLKKKLRKWQLIALGVLLVLLFSVSDFEKAELKNKDYIARINIEGIIVDDDYRDKIISEIMEDKHAKALILRVDSPGGSTGAGENLYSQIREISASGKPVAVVQRSLAASAGYMISVAGDRIFARNGTITGSIGVLVQSAEITELAKKLGVQMETFKSSDLKASPSPFEKTSAKAAAVTQEVVDDYYNYFVGLVAARRNFSKEDALKIADGRIYTGQQALKNGLIDEIGGDAEAIKWLQTARKISKDLKVEDVSTDKPPETLRDILLGRPNEIEFFKKMNMSGLLSIWQPSL